MWTLILYTDYHYLNVSRFFNVINKIHKLTLLSLINQMPKNCIPLQEEGICEIAKNGS